MMTIEERKHARRVLDSSYAKALEAVRHIQSTEDMVTTTDLVNAGVVSGVEASNVMTTALVLGWVLIYPMGRTVRWWLTPEGKTK